MNESDYERTYYQRLRQGRAAITSVHRSAQANDMDNRRFTRRYLFFHPVSITPANDHRRSYSAFSRDISESGIGLLHVMPLNGEDVELKIQTASGTILLRAKIAWCQPAGDG